MRMRGIGGGEEGGGGREEGMTGKKKRYRGPSPERPEIEITAPKKR